MNNPLGLSFFSDFDELILGKESVIENTGEGINELKDMASRLNTGIYASAFSSALQLLMDSDTKIDIFLGLTIPHMQHRLELNKTYGLLDESSDINALLEGLVIHASSMLNGYLESADIVLKALKDVTQERLLNMFLDGLDRPEPNQLRLRERQAYEAIRQYTESYELEPVPVTNPLDRLIAGETMLEMMRTNPSGIGLLALYTHALEQANETFNGVYNYRIKGLKTGSARYENILNMYFR